MKDTMCMPPSETTGRDAAKVSKGRPQSPLVAAAAAKSPRRGDSPHSREPVDDAC